MFFFKLYESPNLADKLHSEEWSPGVDQALMITVQLGTTFIVSIFFIINCFFFQEFNLLLALAFFKFFINVMFIS